MLLLPRKTITGHALRPKMGKAEETDETLDSIISQKPRVGDTRTSKQHLTRDGILGARLYEA